MTCDLRTLSELEHGVETTYRFEQDFPLSPDLERLFVRHTAEMHADTPPESIHMMPREDLVADTIDFFVLRDQNDPIGMVALKRLDHGQAEIKSMHVLAEHRGRGLSRLMLNRLLDHARGSGVTRLYLETGAQPSFAAARTLYEGAGFRYCPPFGTYVADPNSVFMTLAV